MQPVCLRRRCVRRLRRKFVQVRGLLRMCGQVRRKCAAVAMLVRSWPNGLGAPGLLREALPMLREEPCEWLRGVQATWLEELRGVQQTQCAKCFDPTRLQCWQLLKDPCRYRTETPNLYRYPRDHLKS